MSYLTAPILENYDSLRKQYVAMRSLAHSFEMQLRYYQNEVTAERHARNALDSERSANEMLTNRVEELEAIIAKLRKERA